LTDRLAGKDRHTDEWTEGRIDKWTVNKTNRDTQMDGQTDR